MRMRSSRNAISQLRLLEDLDDALRYALGAGDLFDIAVHSEYTETLIGELNHVIAFVSLTFCLI
jgi:hypothetical protein